MTEEVEKKGMAQTNTTKTQTIKQTKKWLRVILVMKFGNYGKIPLET